MSKDDHPTCQQPLIADFLGRPPCPARHRFAQLVKLTHRLSKLPSYRSPLQRRGLWLEIVALGAVQLANKPLKNHGADVARDSGWQGG